MFPSLFKNFPQFVVVYTVKLESRLPGEISITSDMQMIPATVHGVAKELDMT